MTCTPLSAIRHTSSVQTNWTKIATFLAIWLNIPTKAEDSYENNQPTVRHQSVCAVIGVLEEGTRIGRPVPITCY